MRARSLTPNTRAEFGGGFGGTRGSLLSAYGRMFSDPRVHGHAVDLEPPFFPFNVPCPFTPERVEAEVVAKLAYARESTVNPGSYTTIRPWFSDSDKPPDAEATWRELGFMRGSPSMLLAFGNEDRIGQLLHVPSTYAQALASVLSSKMPRIQCETDSEARILGELRDRLLAMPERFEHALLDVYLPPPFFRLFWFSVKRTAPW